MNLDLTGKNALVCGSSKGIGKACAQELAALGANVTLLARREKVLAEVNEELDKSKGQKHDFLVVDFSDTKDLKKKMVNLAQVKNIHILINNTGGPPGGPIIDAGVEEFLDAYKKHIVASHTITQEVLKGMKEDGFGRIINIISTSVKMPIDGLGVSNTTRAAMANWAKTMSNELAPLGITVNNLLPGSTKTERLTEIISARATKANINYEVEEEKWLNAIPMKRFGVVEEIAAAVGFLASPAASYITGINLPVDGGKTRSL